MPDIRSLTLADRSLVTEYLHRYPPEISEHTFSNLFIWQPSRPVYLTEIDNSLIFLVKSVSGEVEYILYGPPAGNIIIPDIISAFGSSARGGSASGVRVIGAVRIPYRNTENLPWNLPHDQKRPTNSGRQYYCCCQQACGRRCSDPGKFACLACSPHL